MTPKPGAIIIEGHVQGLSNTRSLGESDIQVVVVDTGDCVARYSRYCQGFYKCPSFDSDDLADFLIKLAIVKGFEGWFLMPSNDHAVLTLSRNKTRLEKHFKVITPELEIIENIYDKSRLLDVAEKAGVPIPVTYYANDAALETFPLSFPLLTRGRFGLDFYRATGRKAFLADNIDELCEQLSFIDRKFPIQNSLTQELIPDDGINKTISFTAFCLNGEIKTYWMGEKLREHPIRFGTATFARSIYVKECYTQSVRLLKALDYTGVCEVEYLKDPRDGQYKLIEINARTWLWVGLAIECGINFPVYIYNHVNNIKTQYPNTYKIDIFWRNFWTDLIFSLKYILKGQLPYSDYKNSLRKKMVYAVKSKSDPGPFKKMLKLLFLRWRNN